MDFEREHALETYRSMVAIGTESLKALQLINGGAIVALLAFLGQATDRTSIAQLARPSLGWFVAGLVAATLAFICTYLTQFALFNELERGQEVKFIKHMVWLRLAIALAILSTVSFALGSYAAIAAIAS